MPYIPAGQQGLLDRSLRKMSASKGSRKHLRVERPGSNPREKADLCRTPSLPGMGLRGEGEQELPLGEAQACEVS